MSRSSLCSLAVAVVGLGVLITGSTVACRAGEPGSETEPAAQAMAATASTTACAAGTLTYTFTNSCDFTVWVGQHSPSQPVAPQGGSWQVPAASSIDFCMPEAWTSGTFWGRTGCSGSGTTLNCATGQCGAPGMLDCGSGNNGGTPMNPVSQFEVTSITQSSAPTLVANYDLSLVAGYNVPMKIEPRGGSQNGGACAVPQCTSDLNATCPAGLQDTVPTVTTQTSIPCGSGTYCPEGVCVGGTTCVVGCLDPCTQCVRNPSAPGLDCGGQVDNLTYTGCDGNTYEVTNQDLYCAKNTQVANGDAMASANQGTPTCFGDVDCPPGDSCVTSGFASGFQPPAGSGVCIDPSSLAYSGNGVTCGASNVGTACGGYLQDYASSNALGYTCQSVTLSDGSVAYPCLPPLTTGMGTCTKPDAGKTAATLYTAVGGVFNQAWVDAGTTAGGGTTPYYETFHAACPNAYAWQYDDAVGGFACGNLTGFDVTFCP